MELTLKVRISSRLIQYLINILFLGLTCAILYGINPNLVSSLDQNPSCINLLPFVLLFIASYAGSEIASVLYLPRVLGMIIAGIIVRNTTALQFDPLVCSLLRNIALSAILLEGGLGFDLEKIVKVSGTALSLCFVPLIVDIIVTGVLSYFILGLPIMWSIMLGCILSAACAAIIVPFMIELRKRRLGTNKSIPDIILTAASMDDVTAIAGFGIMLGFAFPDSVSEAANESQIWTYVRGPFEIFCGIAIGLVYGTFVGILPLDTLYEDKPGRSLLVRISLLLFGAIGCVFFLERMDLRGAGPLSALTLAMFAAARMRKSLTIADMDQVSRGIHVIWSLMSPLFFALIGTEADLRQEFFYNSGQSLIFSCIAVVAVGMGIRVIATFLSLSCSDLNYKEKIYISTIWLAKAAVQATIGPIALDAARQKGLVQEMEFGRTIVLVSLIAILLSAPTATLAMNLLADICLTQEPSY